MADLTWGTIKEWKSAHLDSVVEGLLNQRNKAMGVHEQIRDIDVTTGWEGNGASASQNALARLKDICAHHLGLIGELMTATSSAQSGLSEVEHAVAEAQSFADSNGFPLTMRVPFTISVHPRHCSWLPTRCFVWGGNRS